jgi:hypothetical protein
MKKGLLAASLVAFCAALFAFVNQPQKQKLAPKWFKYRTGESGVPAADATTAKQDSYYVLSGDNPYCGGKVDFCGIYAEPTDASPSALPIIDMAEETQIDNYFMSPGTYSGTVIDRTN